MCPQRKWTTAYILRPSYVVTNIKGPEVTTGLILTATERSHRDELIIARMYGLEIEDIR